MRFSMSEYRQAAGRAAVGQSTCARQRMLSVRRRMLSVRAQTHGSQPALMISRGLAPQTKQSDWLIL